MPGPFRFVYSSMTIAHETIKGEVVNSRLGELNLDHRGIVTNLADLKCDPAEVLTLPGFKDADLYPPKGYTPGQGAPVDNAPKGEVTDDELWAIICELTGPEGQNLNSEGFIDMKVLLETLRSRGLKAVTGKRRLELTVARQKTAKTP